MANIIGLYAGTERWKGFVTGHIEKNNGKVGFQVFGRYTVETLSFWLGQLVCFIGAFYDMLSIFIVFVC